MMNTTLKTILPIACKVLHHPLVNDYMFSNTSFKLKERKHRIWKRAVISGRKLKFIKSTQNADCFYYPKTRFQREKKIGKAIISHQQNQKELGI